jgi:hypothetical protein
MINNPTPYPEVNIVLDALLPDVQEILGQQFVGMYLYGSLAYGGFDRASDVDFIVITEGVLSGETFLALQTMHEQVARLDSWCATQLEGSYTPHQALKTFDPRNVFHLHIDRGPGEKLQQMQIDDPKVSRAWWGGWVFMRHVLREHGIPLEGPSLQVLIEPVQSGELRQAAQANLEGWLEPLLDHPDELMHFGYQSYCVLTVCRLLFTLETDRITTKQNAARWVQEKLEARWSALIGRALIDRQGPPDPVPPEAILETQDFIRYTMEFEKRRA